MSELFLCYRIEDSERETARLEADLKRTFGEAAVFRDKAGIAGGQDWPQRLRDALAASRVVLVMIGSGWATASSKDPKSQGFPRLSEPEDWVRREVEAALGAGKALPILCDAASMPDREWLERCGLAALADVQAMRLRTSDWARDLQAIAARLRALCPTLTGRHEAPMTPLNTPTLPAAHALIGGSPTFAFPGLLPQPDVRRRLAQAFDLFSRGLHPAFAAPLPLRRDDAAGFTADWLYREVDTWSRLSPSPPLLVFMSAAFVEARGRRPGGASGSGRRWRRLPWTPSCGWRRSARRCTARHGVRRPIGPS